MKKITEKLWLKLRNSVSKSDDKVLDILQEIIKMAREKGIGINDIRYDNPLRPPHAYQSLMEMVIWLNVAIPEDYKIKCIEYLVSEGVSVNGKSGYHGGTPLHFAAGSVNVNLMKRLLELGANINEPDIDEGLTPLHWAARNGLEACEVLVEAGADTTIKSKAEELPEDYADEQEIRLYLTQVRIMMLEQEALMSAVKPITGSSSPKKRI